MNSSNPVTAKYHNALSTGSSIYVTTDGLVKSCVTAPLLELPVDFKEWYKPARSNVGQLH